MFDKATTAVIKAQINSKGEMYGDRLSASWEKKQPSLYRKIQKTPGFCFWNYACFASLLCEQNRKHMFLHFFFSVYV